ncbi:MAG: methylenetetrahydrofolate reductase, partial [Muribaculaceae bacterium]|nr:methylenetetrahydrofolate reductase [Muribaculaceae bacterium]
YNPAEIKITTHRSEMVFKSTQDGLYRRVSERSRPGTVAVATAIQHRYNIPAVPHLICSGYSRLETEYALIDLNFLGITNLLLLRGDKAKHDPRFIPNPDGYSHALELQNQVNAFNRGQFIDGTPMDILPEAPFSYGVAGYPEKHEESPNMAIDLQWLKAKVDAGADYVVTQMFFDNSKYFKFVEMAKEAGINVPIIPGIKPIVNLNQLTLLPKVFRTDLPDMLAKRLMECKDDKEAKIVGIDWCLRQSSELYEAGVPSIHFYSHNAITSVKEVVSQLF